jgi:hypothetical protein
METDGTLAIAGVLNIHSIQDEDLFFFSKILA